MKNKVILAYLAVCLFWGSTYLAIRIGVTDFPPFTFCAIRFLIAGVIVLLYSKFKKLEFPSNKSTYINQSIIGIILLLGGTGIVSYAEKTVDSSIASLLISTVPLFIALWEVLIFKRKSLSKFGVLGLIIGFVGVSYLIMSGHKIMSFDIKGMGLVLMAAIFWSIGTVFSHMIKKDGDVAVSIGIQMVSGGIALFILGFIFGEFSNVIFSLKTILAIAYLIIFGSLVGYSSYIYLLQHWPASRVGTYAYVNPIVALILGHFILGEPVSFDIVISMIVIILGVILVQKSKIEEI